MPARINSTHFQNKRPVLQLTCVPVLILLLLFAATSYAQIAAHSPGWVVLPVEDYRALHARAFPTDRDPEPPPVEATLTRVDYDIRINGDLASGRATLTVDVLKDGWVRVPVPAGLLVREARLDGKLVSLVTVPGGKAGGQLSALLSHPGRSVLLLDIALPVASSTGEESISLPATASGVTRASVQLPRQGVDIKLVGGLLSQKSESASESKWIAYGRGNEALTFTWRRKTEGHRTTQPLRLRGSLTQLLGLGEDSTSINAEVNFEVTQGAAHEVKIQIPEKVTVNQVLGAMVADWEVKAGLLSVTFLEPVEQRARFVITGETRCPREGPMDIPLLRLLDAERETGGVAVEVLGAGEIKDAKAQGLEPADAAELGTMVVSRQSPSLAAYRFRTGSSRSLSVNVARYAQQAVLTANIEEARYRVLMTADGKTLIQARYAVRNNQRNFVGVILPAGASVWSASLAGHPVRPGQGPDGSLLFPLAKGRAGDDAPPFAIEILYSVRSAAWNPRGRVELALPVLDLPVSRTGLVLYYPPLFRIAPEAGAFRSQPYEAPASEVLTGGSASLAPLVMEGQDSLAKQSATQALVDKYRARSNARKTAEVLPIRVSFPSMGPSVFLVSELTGESKGAVVDLSYQKDGKGGVK
jgi:hypothetical protein